MDRKGQVSPSVLKEPTVQAPCQQACPAGIDIPRYLSLIAAGRVVDALAVIREKIPFVSVCGHACLRPCETKCRLNQILGEPIAINALKRYVSDQSPITSDAWSPVAKKTGKRVAVVGSGPAGLTAAYFLATKGHSVTVFEALSELGGMMRCGVSQFRLPRYALDDELLELRKIGIEMKVNAPVKSLNDLAGYDAVFLGLGAHVTVPLGIPGEDSPRVLGSVPFLRDVNSGKAVKLGRRVAVIGGGDAAIDSARVALRLGAKKVSVIYRRTREEMPAHSDAVDQALEEGAEIVFLAAPTRITTENRVLTVEFTRMKLGKPDAEGRASVKPVKGSEFEMKFDSVIKAIGHRADVPAGLGLAMTGEGTLAVDGKTLMTSRKGVFAGGDVTSAQRSIIDAIAAGRQAAMQIDKYLGGTGDIERTLGPAAVLGLASTALPTWIPSMQEQVAAGQMKPTFEHPYTVYTATRVKIPVVPPEQRVRSFIEVEGGLMLGQVVDEAKRCLRCGFPMLADPSKCCACYQCALVCSSVHEGVIDPSKAYIKIDKSIQPDGAMDISISFTDKCVNCGVCAKYCPYGALAAGGCGVREPSMD